MSKRSDFQVFSFRTQTDDIEKKNEKLVLDGGIRMNLFEKWRILQNELKDKGITPDGLFMASAVGNNKIGKSTILNEIFETTLETGKGINNNKATTKEIIGQVVPEFFILDTQGFGANTEEQIDPERLKKKDKEITRAIFRLAQIIIVYFDFNQETQAFHLVSNTIRDLNKSNHMRMLPKEEKPLLLILLRLNQTEPNEESIEKKRTEIEKNFQRFVGVQQHVQNFFSSWKIFLVPPKIESEEEKIEKTNGGEYKENSENENEKKQLNSLAINFKEIRREWKRSITLLPANSFDEIKSLSSFFEKIPKKSTKNENNDNEESLDEEISKEDIIKMKNDFMKTTNSEEILKVGEVISNERKKVKENNNVSFDPKDKKKLLKSLERIERELGMMNVIFQLDKALQSASQKSKEAKMFKIIMKQIKDFIETKTISQNLFNETIHKVSMPRWINILYSLQQSFHVEAYLSKYIFQVLVSPKYSIEAKKVFHDSLNNYIQSLQRVSDASTFLDYNFSVFGVKKKVFLKEIKTLKESNNISLEDDDKKINNNEDLEDEKNNIELYRNLKLQGEMLFNSVKSWLDSLFLSCNKNDLRSLKSLFTKDNFIPPLFLHLQYDNSRTILFSCLESNFVEGFDYLIDRKEVFDEKGAIFLRQFKVNCFDLNDITSSVLEFMLQFKHFNNSLKKVLQILTSFKKWGINLNPDPREGLVFLCFGQNERRKERIDNVEAFTILLENGCNILEVNKVTGNNVVHQAVENNSFELCLAIGQFCKNLDSNENFETLKNAKNKSNQTPLQLCQELLKKKKNSGNFSNNEVLEEHSLSLIESWLKLKSPMTFFDLLLGEILSNSPENSQKLTKEFEDSPISFLDTFLEVQKKEKERLLRKDKGNNKNNILNNKDNNSLISKNVFKALENFTAIIERIRSNEYEQCLSCFSTIKYDEKDLFGKECLETIKSFPYVKKELTRNSCVFFYKNFVVKKIFHNIKSSLELETLSKFSKNENNNKINNNNITPLRFHFESDFSVCLVFDRYSSTLSSYIKELSLDISLIARNQPNDPEMLDFVSSLFFIQKIILMTEVSKCISEVHSRHLIHKDLKPGNVFIRRITKNMPIEVRLGDFGSAQPEYNIKDGSITKGTVTDSVLIGQTFVHDIQKAYLNDIYCLGVTYLFILTGESVVLYSKPLNEPISRNSSLPNPESIKNLVQKLKFNKIIEDLVFSCYFCLESPLLDALSLQQRALVSKVCVLVLETELKKEIEKFIEKLEGKEVNVSFKEDKYLDLKYKFYEKYKFETQHFEPELLEALKEYNKNLVSGLESIKSDKDLSFIFSKFFCKRKKNNEQKDQPVDTSINDEKKKSVGCSLM